LGWDKNDPVLFGGSTHPGEEKILMKIFQKLRASHPKLRLFLAPRHVERVQELIAEAQAFDIKLARKSELNGSAPYSSVILDTTGELKELYPLGSIVFIGKSLTGIGGQNFLEPAKYGCAIVAGPELSNFSALAQLFLQDQSLVQVRDEQQLEKEISTLFNQPSERRQLGQNAATLFKRHLGAARKTAEMILS
jgi:3-deoxy-D-manno-octulosonic-acid transferase